MATGPDETATIDERAVFAKIAKSTLCMLAYCYLVMI